MRALLRFTCQPQLLMLHAANGLWKLYHFFFKFICLGQRPRRLLLFLSFIFAFVLIFACQPCAKVNSVSAHSTGKGQVGSPSPTWPAYTLEANFNLRSKRGKWGLYLPAAQQSSRMLRIGHQPAMFGTSAGCKWERNRVRN